VGVLKTIPMPLILMGAGLWLSRQKTAPNLSGLGASVSDMPSTGTNQVSQSFRGAKESLANTADAVTSKARSTAHDLRDSIGAASDSLTASVKENAVSAANMVSETTSDLQESASRLASQSRNIFTDLVDRNPLVIGGLALAVGAFIAASLPSSEVENRMFGAGSDAVKDKALEAVSDGVERAKAVTSGVVENVANAATQEGLHPDSLGRAIEGITDGVKAIVDKGLNTALGAVDGVQPQIDSKQQEANNGGELQ
jgi:hypothetical protein